MREQNSASTTPDAIDTRHDSNNVVAFQGDDSSVALHSATAPADLAPKTFPMLPWFPASFMSSTRGWSVTARGIYRELLDTQWEIGGLPEDPKALQRLINATPREWKDWTVVQGKFPLCPDGLRRNRRLEQHRDHALQKSSKARASAQERWRQKP